MERLERLLTPEEVADILVVSPKTVSRWLRQGKLKGIKPGKDWRVRQCDLEAFIESLANPQGEEEER